MIFWVASASIAAIVAASARRRQRDNLLEDLEECQRAD
jgi:hypothetical protein